MRGLTLLVACGLMASQSSANAVEQSAFVVAYNETTAPLVSMVQAIYAEMGIRPVFKLVPSERAIEVTSSGGYDADLSRVEGTESMYPDLVRSREPLKITELYAFARKGSGITIRHADDLKQRKLGFVRGSKLVEEFLQESGLQAQAANQAGSFYSMLSGGRFEIALVTSTQLLSQSQDQMANVERVGPVLMSRFSYHVFNKKHAELVPRFDAVLRAMKADGRSAK
jgi:ABC-type amino acid transport substrate-binding protein